MEEFLEESSCKESAGSDSARFMPKPLRIGALSIDPPLVLAPMAGITDAPFRRVAARYGAGLVTTGMVSAEGIRRKQPGSWELFAREGGLPVPLAVQIFGSAPAVVAEAARIVEENGAELIDINAGCPVKKVLRQGAGAGLLRMPDHLVRLVEETRKAVSTPLTVKVRLGWDADSIGVVDLVRRLESAGADAVSIHARTAVQKYRGAADWDWIKRAKAAVAIPVIGNGDVTTPLLADRMARETGCDGVMIGRASLGNPWLIAAIAARWKGCAPAPAPDWGEYLDAALGHASDFLNERPRSVGQARMLLVWYSRGCPEAARLRGTVMQINKVDELFEVFRRWVGDVESKGTPFLPTKVSDGPAAVVQNEPEPWDAEDGASREGESLEDESL